MTTTFPSYNPSYSATKTSQPRTRIIQFGDGYQQRNVVGLNQDPKVWNLTFNVDDEDADEIETFLEARGQDGAFFNWAPPDETATYKWICRSFSREMFEFQRNRKTVTFEQVFDIG